MPKSLRFITFILFASVLSAAPHAFATEYSAPNPFFCLEFFERTEGAGDRLFTAYARALEQYREEIGETRFQETLRGAVGSGNYYRFGAANPPSPIEGFLEKFGVVSREHEGFDERVRNHLKRTFGVGEEISKTVERAVETTEKVDTYIEKIEAPLPSLERFKIREDLSQSAQAAHSGDLIIRDLKTKQIVSQIHVEGRLTDYKLNEDWTKVAILSRTGIVTVWDLETGAREFELRPSKSDLSEIQMASWLFVDRAFTRAASGRSGEAKFLWDLTKKTEIARFDEQQFDLIDSRFHFAVMSGPRSESSLVDLRTGSRTVLISDNGYGVFKFANADFTQALASSNGKITLWDLAEKKAIYAFGGSKGEALRTVYVSKDFKWALGRDDDVGAVYLIDLDAKRDVQTWKIPSRMGDGRVVTAFQVSPDRRKVAFGFGSGDLEIFDIATGRILGRAKTGPSVRSIDATEDFGRAVVSDGAGSIYFVNFDGIEGRE